MDLREINLKELVVESKRAFPNKRPSKEELQNVITPMVMAAGFGVGEAIALAALILAVWNRISPKKNPDVPFCKKLYKGKMCRQHFIETEKDEKYITLWCIRKHKTKLRIA